MAPPVSVPFAAGQTDPKVQDPAGAAAASVGGAEVDWLGRADAERPGGAEVDWLGGVDAEWLGAAEVDWPGRADPGRLGGTEVDWLDSADVRWAGGADVRWLSAAATIPAPTRVMAEIPAITIVLSRGADRPRIRRCRGGA